VRIKPLEALVGFVTVHLEETDFELEHRFLRGGSNPSLHS
jgi:hypothetical protein